MKRIKKDSDGSFMIDDRYHGEQEVESKKNLEHSLPSNHQFAMGNSKENIVSYVSDNDAARDDDKEVTDYLSENLESASMEKFYFCNRKRFPILYQLVRDIITISAISASAWFQLRIT